MIKSTLSLCLALSFLFLFSCDEKTTDEPIKLPTNLTINVEYQGDGLVKATFTADMAVYYKVNFGTPGEAFTKVAGNSATKTFTVKGDFTLTVQAHTTEKDFISGTQIIQMNAAALGLDPNTGYSSPTTYGEYNLVWSDEFSGSELSQVWQIDLGDGCPLVCDWGNNELQYYAKENLTLSEGKLIITAKKENAGTKNYTSGRLNTRGKTSFTYGRVDIRAKLPKGKGFWPGFWMLGENVGEVGWPKSGAIHIMEMIGGPIDKGDATNYGTSYWDNANKTNLSREKSTLPFGNFSDEYHVFSIVWDAQKIVWEVDGVQYHSLVINPSTMDELQKPFYFIFNLAIGGNAPGSPDENTIFPQNMSVDYIRLFQKK